MRRSLIDRYTDTTPFRAALLLAAIIVMPVLALGLFITVGLLGVAVREQVVVIEGAVFVALSIGGAVGVVGWLRARYGVNHLATHNVTATLACLSVGVATAFAVCCLVAAWAIAVAREPLGWPAEVWWVLVLVAPLAVWMLSGVAGMQRLTRAYSERAGRAFDDLPVVLLLVALALSIAAALVAAAL